jgi:hypothetical protein
LEEAKRGQYKLRAAGTVTQKGTVVAPPALAVAMPQPPLVYGGLKGPMGAPTGAPRPSPRGYGAGLPAAIPVPVPAAGATATTHRVGGAAPAPTPTSMPKPMPVAAPARPGVATDGTPTPTHGRPVASGGPGGSGTGTAASDRQDMVQSAMSPAVAPATPSAEAHARQLFHRAVVFTHGGSQACVTAPQLGTHLEVELEVARAILRQMATMHLVSEGQGRAGREILRGVTGDRALQRARAVVATAGASAGLGAGAALTGTPTPDPTEGPDTARSAGRGAGSAHRKRKASEME